MGTMAAGAAGGPLGLALGGLSLLVTGMGEAAGASHQSAQAARAAEIGKVQADQIHASHTDELNRTISGVRAVRAATGASPDSPTSLAFIEGEADASDRSRRIRAGAARMGARQNEADARFYRASAGMALFGRTLQAGAHLAGGYA